MKHYSKFLASLENMSNKEMIKACKDAGLKLLGTGSTRLVFALNERLVIKIATGQAGVDQNEIEIRTWHMLDYDFNKHKRFYAKVHVDLCHFKDYFLVMERLTKSFSTKRSYIRTIERAYFGSPCSKDIKRAEQHYKAAKELDFHLSTLNANDMHPGNIGINSKGIVKSMDYGFHTMHRKYYNRRLSNAEQRARLRSVLPGCEA